MDKIIMEPYWIVTPINVGETHVPSNDVDSIRSETVSKHLTRLIQAILKIPSLSQNALDTLFDMDRVVNELRQTCGANLSEDTLRSVLNNSRNKDNERKEQAHSAFLVTRLSVSSPLTQSDVAKVNDQSEFVSSTASTCDIGVRGKRN